MLTDYRKGKNHMEKIIYEIDASNGKQPELSTDLFEGRSNYIKSLENKMGSDVTIFVQAYNRLDKTKECISNILKYTSGINYDLLLIDNGSTDETFEYFKSVNYDKVRIIHINKNISSFYPMFTYDLSWFSKYIIGLPNDVVVTKNWLSNLIKVMESDEKIGMVNAVSSNVSNLQMVDLQFDDMDDMQKKAAAYNISDPSKWHERMRLITLGSLYRKECLYAIGWPINDIGFFHDFSDDDISFRVRRAGYKVVLAEDTWIHHNHDVFSGEGKDPVKFQQSLDIGRKNFRDKYHGIDAWDDVNNYVFPYLDEYISEPADTENVKILGIDTKCGTPILDVKNNIRKFGVFNPEVSAFTRDGKYDTDLKTICNGMVVCDRPEFIGSSFDPGYFDYIIIENEVNNYSEPVKFVYEAYKLLKTGGQLFISLKNTYNVLTMMTMLGYDVGYKETAAHYSLYSFYAGIREKGMKIELVNREMYNLSDEYMKYLANVIAAGKAEDTDENVLLTQLMINRYWFKIVR